MNYSKKNEPSRKMKHRECKRRKRLKYVNSKRTSPDIDGAIKMSVVKLKPGIKLSAIPYDDMLEVSRLTEELILGHDISHVQSPSKVAKDYVQNFSKNNRGSQAVEAMYNTVNRKLVLMNRGSVRLTGDSLKLYRELMDKDSDI